MKDKMEKIEEDRNWLSKQIKIVMKEKNALEHKLREIAQSNPTKMEDFEDLENVTIK